MAGQGVTPYLITLIAISTLGSLQFGFHLAELNAPQDVITCHRKSVSTVARIARFLTSVHDAHDAVDDCIPMDEAAFATVSSIFTVGGLIGALAAGPFSSRRGRLLAMRATALLFIAGSTIESVAHSVLVMALGRFLSGIGAGAATVIVPLYISEVCPPDRRGFFGFMTQISINVGILITQTSGFFLSYGSAWRWNLGIGAFIAAAQGLGLMIVPESPAWLAAHDDVAGANKTLQRIRGHAVDASEEREGWGRDASGAAEEERGLLAQDADADDVPPPNATSAKNEPVHLGFLQVVRDPNTRPVIIALVGIMFVQQLCGINSVIMYSVSLLADLLPISSALLSILVSLVNLVTTVACSPLPDRLGRKACLIMSIVGQGSSALVLALSIVFGFKVVSAFAVLFFVAFFAVGLGPVPFILASELVGQEAVGATQSWCLGANYVATFLVAQFFPIVNKALNSWLGGQGWVYFIFAGLAALSFVFVTWSFRSLRFHGATGN
ncbi:putative metabolite transport protein [Trichoderma ghanense]|uniref:Metabolite transport protein n=1 Tax=Trichoderma ghanense TaxID=65468 RepID=A0ABY2HEJ6_9HYPO